jgi:hypothetical protein
MIRLVIDGVDVPVPDNFSVQLNADNPLFAEKPINSVYSYNFFLPDTMILNNLLKNSNRVNAKDSNTQLPVKIYHSGIVFVEGKLKLTKTQKGGYSCYVLNEAMDTYNQMKAENMRDCPMDSIELWTEDEDTTLSLAFKSKRWKDHMFEVLAEPITEGKYKFPQILAKYEEQEIPFTSWLVYTNPSFQAGGGVNTYKLQDYSMSEPRTNGTLAGGDKQWYFTVAPCVKVNYILQAVSEWFGFFIEENGCDSIEEYNKLITFAGCVLDKWLQEGGAHCNVHGRVAELNKMMPDTNAWAIMQMIHELYNAIFIFQDGNMFIRLANQIIDSKPVNMTAFSEDFYTKERTDEEGIIYQYDLTDEILPNFNYLVSNFPNPIAYRNYALPLRINASEDTKAITLSFRVLRDIYGYGDTRVTSFDDYINNAGTENVTGFYHAAPVLDCAELLLYSEEYENTLENRPWKFFTISKYEGVHQSNFFTSGDVAGGNPPSGIENNVFASPMDSTAVHRTVVPVLPDITFGTKHIWMGEEPGFQDSEEKGQFNNYFKRLYDLKNGSKVMEKTLFLPPHKVKELSTFKEPKHVIDSPEGKFEGFVQKFSVTLYKDRISPTKVTYLIEQYD